jgi:RNA polymerase sigma-B factor
MLEQQSDGTPIGNQSNLRTEPDRPVDSLPFREGAGVGADSLNGDTALHYAPHEVHVEQPRAAGISLKDEVEREQRREELILRHQKLVRYVAARFVGSGETLEDLIQVGNIGLINAIDRYDATKEVKFSTYAMPTIVGEIKRHFRDKTWQVKVPRWLQELSINARKAQQSLALKLARPPTVREIADEVGASEDRTLEALEITHMASTVSLDTRLNATTAADGATLMDVIGRMDRGLTEIDAYTDLRRAIGLLEPRERQIIEMRFFEDLSQARIARQLSISQMHVSRLQQRALQSLRGILADETNRPHRKRRKPIRSTTITSPMKEIPIP